MSLASVLVCGHAGKEEEMGTGRKKAASDVIFNQSFLSPGSLSQQLNTVPKGVTVVGCSFLNQQNVCSFFPPARLGRLCIHFPDCFRHPCSFHLSSLFLGKKRHKSFLAPDVRVLDFILCSVIPNERLREAPPLKASVPAWKVLGCCIR